MKKKSLFIGVLLSLCFSCTKKDQKLVVIERIDVQTTLAREPMFAMHPNGAIFLTGYTNTNEEPRLWKSMDDGKTWDLVNVGSIEEGADGNSDVDLVIDQDGVIYFLTMKYTRLPENTEDFDFSSMKGEHIAIGVSKDGGDTWKWAYLSKNPFDDRPWVEVSSNKSAHVIWNDGKGVHHVRSVDKGETWEQMAPVSTKGGSSHFSSGPNGQLAARITPLSASGTQYDEGLDLLRLSQDNGKTWKDVELPGERQWSAEFGEGTPRWVEPIGWDSENRLYTLWSERNQLKLARSENNGMHWQTWLVVEGDQMMYFPYMTVRDGTVACSWISGLDESLRHHAAVITIAKGQPHVFELNPQQLNIWTRFEGGEHQLSTGGEYFPIIHLNDQEFGMVTAIQNGKDEEYGFTWWRLALE